MPTNHSNSIKPFVGRFIGMAILLVGGAAFSPACDTPVYRYAMYRWEPAPYEIYYFHDQPLDEQAERVKGLVEEVSRSEDKPVNAFFLPVSLTDDPELKRIPPDVRKAWQNQDERSVPTYWVVTPHGRRLFQGALDEATLRAMWDSPARTGMAQQLADGKAGVLVLLEGSDAAANDSAEQVAKELVAEVAGGKIELYLSPNEAMEDESDAAPRLEFGLTRISRTDPAEKWLVDALLSLEDDLRDEQFAAQPMIFAVFGRGRALPPFVGKGITRDNLLECVYFLTGACSCTVKEQNPGMDLLFAEDWWSVAENLASTFGAEEGNERQLGADQLFPHLMIPGGEPVERASDEAADSGPSPPEVMAAAPAAEAVARSPEQAGAAASAEASPQGTVLEDSQKERETSQASPRRQPGGSTVPGDIQKEQETAVAAAASEESAAAQGSAAAETAVAAAAGQSHGGARHGTDSAQATSVDALGVFAIGAGLCVALVLLFGVTFLVMRPK